MNWNISKLNLLIILFFGAVTMSFAQAPTTDKQTGCISGNCYNGYGTYVWKSGTQYAGDWKDGQMDGHGEVTYSNGDTYVGEMKKGMKNGHGTYHHLFGSIQDGEWKDDVFTGSGNTGATTTTAPVSSSQNNYLFPMLQNGKLGFIDEQGNVVVEGKYDNPTTSLPEFKDGLFPVKAGRKWGYINTSGVMVIPAIYDKAEAFENGQAEVGKKAKEDKVPMNARDSLYDDMVGGLSALLDSYTGIIDKSGNEVVPLKYKMPMFGGHFSDGMCAVENDDKTGYINERGDLVIDYKYHYAMGFHEGLAAVSPEDGGKYGYIDKTGRMVIPEQFYSAYDFDEGYAIVFKNKGDKFYSIIDKSGNYVKQDIPYEPQGFLSLNFNDGLICVKSNDNGRYGFADHQGNLVINCGYDGAHFNFSEGLVAVNIGGHEEGRGLLKKTVGGKWGFIDNKGEKAFRFEYYDEVSDFSEGLAAVKRDDKWGFVDKTGNLVIKYQFDEFPRPFKHGLSEIREKIEGSFMDYKIGYVDKTGKVVWSLQK